MGGEGGSLCGFLVSFIDISHTIAIVESAAGSKIVIFVVLVERIDRLGVSPVGEICVKAGFRICFLVTAVDHIGLRVLCEEGPAEGKEPGNVILVVLTEIIETAVKFGFLKVRAGYHALSAFGIEQAAV